MSSGVSNLAMDNPSSHDRDLDRMKQAAERYRQAMTNEKDRERLIEDYLPLVKSIVSRTRHHFPDSYEMEDMYGIGAKALVVSVNQFDPSKGKAFGNYASLRIRGALLDELRRIDSLPRANRGHWFGSALGASSVPAASSSSSSQLGPSVRFSIGSHVFLALTK